MNARAAGKKDSLPLIFLNQLERIKIGDVMKDVFKGVLLIVIGLVAAIVVYPFMHELGHSIAAWISGAQIYEFHLFPIPNILCGFDSVSLKSMALVGFSGMLFPAVLTGIRAPKTFLLWYLWFVIKSICALSFFVSLWALVFFQTGLEIANEDMIQILQFAPEYRVIYLAAIIGLLAITVVQLIRSNPLHKCMKYFGV